MAARNRSKFVTAESSGVNAFFVDPSVFPQAFIDEVRGVDFCETSAIS